MTIDRAQADEARGRDGALAEAVGAVVGAGQAAGSGLARAAAAVRQVVTPTGWWVAGIAAAGLVAGYLFGWLEAVVIGWALAVALAAACLYLVGRSAFVVGLELPEPRVVVGDPAEAAVVVTNIGRRRAVGVGVEVRVGGGTTALAVANLSAGVAERRPIEIPTGRRGIVDIGPVRTVRADPVGLVRREVVWAEQSRLYVHPRTIPIPAVSTGFVRDLEGSPTRDLTASDVAFHALREYVPGDDRRHIHWRSSAKTGTFMVRQFEETRRSHMMILLDAEPAHYADPDEFELAVGAVGSLGVRAIRDARGASVIVPSSVPTTARAGMRGLLDLATISRDRLLDALCGVEQDPRAPQLVDAMRMTAESVLGISLAFVVTGSLTGVARLRAAAAQARPGVEVVGVVCAAGAAPASRRVGGMQVLTIGQLDDLRAILARSAAA
ncbi:hypothetical protein ARHIZOSPH14_02050 [Agromyces rhizosphaerae]|uniref:DUF58 domain-containing protein n=1 Tax=Agromyces rhizosphaerae TaxID=88374 RepID=A0A9W6CP69_9MICO|nr:DUF58 domain-containing protein [Agromyces rhizosphaerae]GLI25963.1 hypothetical protein ARHIZOSPH14_02050 [Agromyces rhizosphaerae]